MDQFERLKADVADRYVIERELGRDRSTTVYLARDFKSGRRTVLKLVHPATDVEPLRITFASSDSYVHGGGWAWDGTGLVFSPEANRDDVHLGEPD